MRTLHRVRPLLLLGGIAFLGACTLLTHASDFDVEKAMPLTGICHVCPPSMLDLKHLPCPTPSDAPDTGQVYTYAWRKVHIGLDPRQWHGLNAATYDVGIDQDCSNRPNAGKPVLCQPRILPMGAQTLPWDPLPHGIDNSLGTRVFAPLYQAAVQLLGPDKANIENGISAQYEAGRASVLVFLDHWNGTPNDPQVGFRLVTSPGISPSNGGPPRWDGSDRWDVFSSGPDPDSHGMKLPNAANKLDNAYVSNGILVADLSDRGATNNTLLNNGARLDVRINNFAVTANLSPKKITHLVAVGTWDVEDMTRQTKALASYLTACDPRQSKIVETLLPGLILGAADMPAPESTNLSDVCGQVSIAFGADAEQAAVGNYRSDASLVGCAP